jgi:hypothetical protein
LVLGQLYHVGLISSGGTPLFVDWVLTLTILATIAYINQ